MCTAPTTAILQEIADDITALWADPTIRACYDKRDLYWLLDAAAYYFNEAQVSRVHLIVQLHIDQYLLTRVFVDICVVFEGFDTCILLSFRC